jgi:hypothetical protein
MRYIDLRAVHRLIGTNYPGGARALAQSLEEFLTHAIKSGDRFPEQLLAHNLSGKRNRSLAEMAKVDADMMFTFRVSDQHLNMELKDYRLHQQFARPESERRVVLHLLIQYPDQTQWTIQVPLQALMKGFGDPEEGYQCYSHGIALLNEDGKPKTDEMYYCGITSRNWLKRMAEHLAEMRSGSNKTFHRAWREYQGRADVLLNSELVTLNHSYECAMSWEEWIVDRFMVEKRSLNMLPGGFKGLQVLYKFGLLDRTDNVSIEERDRAAAEYVRKHPRAGTPNLLIAGLWEDDSYYSKVIEGRSNTLSRQQVQRIRELAALGWTEAKIAEDVKARNVAQVRGVLIGRTYSRMH